MTVADVRTFPIRSRKSRAKAVGTLDIVTGEAQGGQSWLPKHADFTKGLYLA